MPEQAIPFAREGETWEFVAPVLGGRPLRVLGVDLVTARVNGDAVPVRVVEVAIVVQNVHHWRERRMIRTARGWRLPEPYDVGDDETVRIDVKIAGELAGVVVDGHLVIQAAE